MFLVNKGKDEAAPFDTQKNDNVHNVKSANKMSRHFNSSPEKPHEKEADGKDSTKIKKSSKSNTKLSYGKRSSVTDGTSNMVKDSSPHNLIDPTITEQFQNIFQDIRIQSRIPVNVPSPPRSYPHPDWIDSTLPSISTASELNVIQSNDT